MVRLDWNRDITRKTARDCWKELKKAADLSTDEGLELALAPEVQLDGSGAAVLALLHERAAKRGRKLRILTVSQHQRRLLALFEAGGASGEAPAKRENVFLRAGERAVLVAEIVLGFLVLTADTLGIGGKALFNGRIAWRGFVEQSLLIGYKSLGIIALISFLVGLTTALQAAYQLKQFGADVYIANMVGLAMVVELGPLMTAILLAGRSGSSIAAEISTMVISEEIDALKTMGVHPIRFVLMPKMLAITLTQPLLTTISDIIGILGGFIIAVTYLDLSPSVFWTQLVGSVRMLDVSQGILKSFVFAWIIGLVSAFIGFRAQGGAAGVGRATTNSVVASIFLVIVADAIFSLIFYFGD